MTAPAPRRPVMLMNPHAFGNRTGAERRRQLAHAFAGLGPVYETDEDDLPGAAAQWARDGVDLVAICGGDGTIHHALNAISGAWKRRRMPRLLVLHRGTTGIVARAARADEPLTSIAQLRRAISRGELVRTRSLPTLRIGDRLGFNFGLGLFCGISAEADRSRRGPRGLGALGVRLVGSLLAGGSLARRALAPFAGRIRVDGHAAAGVGFYATALDEGGLGPVRGLYRTPRPDDGFRYVAVERVDRTLLARAVPFALGWNEAAGRGVVADAAVRVVFTASEPTPFMADGEIRSFVGDLAVGLGPLVEVIDASSPAPAIVALAQVA